MGDRHVVHTERGWRVRKENAQRPSASADTQAEAVRRAIEIVGNDGGGKVIVHDQNGTIRATHDVASGGAPETGEAAAVQADAAASTARSTANKAADTAKQAGERAAQQAEQATAAARDEVADATARGERRADAAAEKAQSGVESAADAAARGARQAGGAAGELVGGTIRRFGGLVRAVGSKAVHTLETTRNIIRRKGSR